MSADRPVRVRTTPEFPGLVISDDGRIQGPSRTWLKGRPDRQGYLYVSTKVRGHHRRQTRTGMHTIICTAFHGPKPSPKHQVAHRNGNPADNSVGNLRWATALENHADKRLHGTTSRGEKNVKAKLTEDQVREMRRRRAGGEKVCDLAREFGLNRHAAGWAISGQTWGHVQ